MNVCAIAISAYAKSHTEEETARLIGRLFGNDMPRDDHGHFYKEAGAPCPHDHEDVTEEYKKNATPGQGKFIVEPGVKKDGKNRHEVEIGQWLHNEFGGDITVLQQRNIPGKKDPDFEWKGQYWELQTPNSWGVHTIDKNMREAIHQIEDNPGGIILDLNICGATLEAAEKDIIHRMRRSADFPADVIILYKQGKYKVIRYKKSSSK